MNTNNLTASALELLNELPEEDRAAVRERATARAMAGHRANNTITATDMRLAIGKPVARLEMPAKPVLRSCNRWLNLSATTQ